MKVKLLIASIAFVLGAVAGHFVPEYIQIHMEERQEASREGVSMEDLKEDLSNLKEDVSEGVEETEKAVQEE